MKDYFKDSNEYIITDNFDDFYKDFWKNVDESRLSSIQPYSNDDIMNLYESAKNNQIISDMVNGIRQETPNEDIDLISMTKAEIIKYAYEQKDGLILPSKMTKANMIAEIRKVNTENNKKRLST